jgi:outer membrane protein OmpU
MKRILLTTTSLVLAAGVAQADVSFSGTAGVALIDDNGASNSAAERAARITAGDTAAVAEAHATVIAARAARNDMFFESYYDFDIRASAESDNGVSVSVGFDMGAGNKIDYNDDDVLEAQGNTVGDADVAVSYAGWTLTVDQAGIDNLFDDDQAAEDVMISGSIAGWSVAMTSDQEGSTSSYKVSGNVGGVALTFTGTDNDDNGGDASKIAASYNMGNGLTLKGSVEDESKADGSEDDSTLGLSYAMGDITVGYTTIKPGSSASFGDEWDFSFAYAAGAVSASFAVDEADATTIIVDYALGGGASAFAAMHDKPAVGGVEGNDLIAMGLNFAF